MDALKSQLLRIQEQLTGLSASQKMLTASLVAIMVMTIAIWGRFAGTAQMEPILEQSFTPADIGQMKMALGSQGIPLTVTGDRVMVPADRKYEALAVLAFNNQLPSNSYRAWDEMLQQSTLWDSSSKTAALHKHMKERLLSDWMTAHFPNVATATVFINDVNQPRVGGSLQPTASVLIKTRGDDVSAKKLVSAAAAAVASAVSGLLPSKVAVIINGQSHHVPDPNSGFSAEADEKAREWERDRAETLERMFPLGSRIAVAVDVERSRRMEQSESFDKTKSLIVEKDLENKTQDSSQPQTKSADPGTVSNTGLDISNATAQNSTNNTESSRTTMHISPGRTTQQVETPAGKPTISSTAIRIPRSYFIRNMARGDSAAKEPDDSAIQTQFDKEKQGWIKTAQTAIGMNSAENISIDMYYDDGGTMVAGKDDLGTSSVGIGAVVGRHAREIAVSGLAVVSLFMLMTIVKKGTPVPVLAVPESPRETPHLAASEDLAGIAGGNSTALDAVELDESAIKAQQMVEQVATMVKENPDAAANLVKRWLNRS